MHTDSVVRLSVMDVLLESEYRQVSQVSVDRLSK